MNEFDHFLDALSGAGQRLHRRIGARQFDGGALGGGAGIVDLLRRIHDQRFDIARRGGDTGDIFGGLCRGVGSGGDLLRHQPVALDEFGGGAANAFAGRGEGIDHLLDGMTEIAGEEQTAGVMQPRLGLAAQLIDRQRVGFDQRGAHRLGGGVKALDGAVADEVGQCGVAVATRDAVERGDDARETAFGENSDRDGAEQADDKRCLETSLQGRHDCEADNEGRHRNPQRGTRDRRSDWRRHFLFTRGEIPPLKSLQYGF